VKRHDAALLQFRKRTVMMRILQSTVPFNFTRVCDLVQTSNGSIITRKEEKQINKIIRSVW